MPRRWLHASAAAVALLVGCQPGAGPAVIAGDGVLCDLTTRLAGDALTVSCLLRPGDDPHQLQLTPRQSAELRQARLLLINGYQLTPALARLPDAVPVAELAVPESPRLEAAQLHSHPHGQAHSHGERDPHVWHDPRQAAAMVRLVSQRLERLAPAAASRIHGRADRMTQTLQDLDRWNRRQFTNLPPDAGRRTLASGHRAFTSLCRAYGLRELAVIDAGSSSDTLRPQALAAAVARLRQERVAALFSDQMPASRSLSRISQLSGVPLAPQALRADGLAPGSAPGTAGDLMSTLTANTCLIVESLGGRCDRVGQQQLIRRWQAIAERAEERPEERPQASQRRSRLL